MELSLSPTSVVLDLGCGRGLYTLAVARLLGGKGQVYGVDLWAEGIAALQEQAEAEGLKNIRAIRGDARDLGALPKAGVDVCLLGTVLHDLVQIDAAQATLEAISRVLKAGGTLAIVEFKKIEGPPGPPRSIRLSPEEVRQQVAAYGFVDTGSFDLGHYNYLMRFSSNAAAGGH